MLPEMLYGGDSSMPTLDLEGDIMRSLSLEAKEDVHLMMVFATMVCDAFHEFETKSPQALWQSHFCTVERFCSRYGGRLEVIELLEMQSMEMLHMLNRRFFPVRNEGSMMSEHLKSVFIKDIQGIMCFVQTKYSERENLKRS